MVIEEVHTVDEGRRAVIAGQLLSTWSHCGSASSLDQPMTCSLHQQTSNNWASSMTTPCSACNKTRGIVEHVLAACGSSLLKYTWRHNKVLQVLADAIVTQCTSINRTSAKEEPNQVINFHREGEQPQQAAIKNNETVPSAERS